MSAGLKALRDVLSDMALGAGLCVEQSDWDGVVDVEALARLLRAIRRRWGLHPDCYVLMHWNVDEFRDLESASQFLYSAGLRKGEDSAPQSLRD